MQVRHSKAYELLAIEAARQSNLKKPTPEAAAGDEAARSLRDVQWMEYERMLRDTQTYSLAAIRQWLSEQAANTVATASIHRDRRALLARERAYALAAGKAKAVIEQAQESGESDVLKGGRVLAGQLLFQALADLSPAALEDLSAKQVIDLIDALSKLSRAHAQTELTNEKVAELRRRFDQQMSAAVKKAKGGGTITDEDISQARKLIFGDAA